MGGRHSTEEAFALLTLPYRVRCPHHTACIIEIKPKNLALRTCLFNLLGVSALRERTKKYLIKLIPEFVLSICTRTSYISPIFIGDLTNIVQAIFIGDSKKTF